jgi:hypothetical protein
MHDYGEYFRYAKLITEVHAMKNIKKKHKQLSGKKSV